MPFGLKNAPEIFQRAVDDVLREFIGKICFVYIDDIIIFSKSEEDHAQYLELIFQTLQQANFKIQSDKCEFLKQEVDFLGFLISTDGIKTYPIKVVAIKNFPIAKIVKELRLFLGLSGFYRSFIRDYVKYSNLLTIHLKGEEGGGHITKDKSSKIPVNLNREAIDVFQKLKDSLTSEDVLTYPIKQEFHLSTDVSNHVIGAVLEQNGIQNID